MEKIGAHPVRIDALRGRLFQNDVLLHCELTDYF